MTQRSADESGSRLSEHDIEFLDRILQDLFGLGLKLEYSLSVLDDAPAQARVAMEDVVSGLDDIVEPLRSQILKLGRSRNLYKGTTAKDGNV